jgi:hypothetical protein
LFEARSMSDEIGISFKLLMVGTIRPKITIFLKSFSGIPSVNSTNFSSSV